MFDYREQFYVFPIVRDLLNRKREHLFMSFILENIIYLIIETESKYLSMAWRLLLDYNVLIIY